MPTPDKSAVMLRAHERGFTVRIARPEAGIIEPPEDQQFLHYGHRVNYLTFEGWTSALHTITSAETVACGAEGEEA